MNPYKNNFWSKNPKRININLITGLRPEMLRRIFGDEVRDAKARFVMCSFLS